jgi:hypothetical protein
MKELDIPSSGKSISSFEEVKHRALIEAEVLSKATITALKTNPLKKLNFSKRKFNDDIWLEIKRIKGKSFNASARISSDNPQVRVWRMNVETVDEYLANPILPSRNGRVAEDAAISAPMKQQIKTLQNTLVSVFSKIETDYTSADGTIDESKLSRQLDSKLADFERDVYKDTSLGDKEKEALLVGSAYASANEEAALAMANDYVNTVNKGGRTAGWAWLRAIANVALTIVVAIVVVVAVVAAVVSGPFFPGLVETFGQTIQDGESIFQSLLIAGAIAELGWYICFFPNDELACE